jgi:hypothetical protein
MNYGKVSDFKQIKYNAFLSLVGVKAEPSLKEIFELMLEKPDETLDLLGKRERTTQNPVGVDRLTSRIIFFQSDKERPFNATSIHQCFAPVIFLCSFQASCSTRQFYNVSHPTLHSNTSQSESAPVLFSWVTWL